MECVSSMIFIGQSTQRALMVGTVKALDADATVKLIYKYLHTSTHSRLPPKPIRVNGVSPYASRALRSQPYLVTSNLTREVVAFNACSVKCPCSGANITVDAINVFTSSV